MFVDIFNDWLKLEAVKYKSIHLGVNDFILVVKSVKKDLLIRHI